MIFNRFFIDEAYQGRRKGGEYVVKNDGSGIYVEDGGGFHRDDTADDYGSSMKHS